MRVSRLVGIIAVSALPMAIGVQNASAQDRIEVGASLITVTFITSGDSGTLIGIPAGVYGPGHPGAYVSFLVGSRVAIEPQIGLIWMSSGGHSDHLLNFATQFTYYVNDAKHRSPYVFATAGVLDTSGAGYSPKSFGAGAGYRVPVGDRLVVRFDGRYVRYTARYGSDLGTFSLTFSIGGLFGK